MQRSIKRAFLVCLVLALATLTVEAQKGAKKPGNSQERFAVTASDEGFVLVEQRTGRTWTLEHSADDKPVWLPIDRIDDPGEAEKWRETRDAEWQEMEEMEEKEGLKAAKHRSLENQLRELTEIWKALATKHEESRKVFDDSFREFGEHDERTRNAQEMLNRLTETVQQHAEEIRRVEKELDGLSAENPRSEDGPKRERLEPFVNDTQNEAMEDRLSDAIERLKELTATHDEASPAVRSLRMHV